VWALARAVFSVFVSDALPGSIREILWSGDRERHAREHLCVPGGTFFGISGSIVALWASPVRDRRRQKQQLVRGIRIDFENLAWPIRKRWARSEEPSAINNAPPENWNA
jgi:hypothetical protein